MTDLSYQLYSSRNFPPLVDTLNMLAGLGYTQVEAYGGLFDDADGLEHALRQSGLTMPSAHFGLLELEQEADRVIQLAEKFAIKAVYCPFIEPDARPTDSAGWRAFGERLNQAGRVFREAGLTFGWHNHDFEFVAQPDGAMPMDELLAGGPDLMWEADIAWIVRGGADPIDWIDRYAGRIAGVHVKDIAVAGEASDEDGWADVGHGTINWAQLMQALKSTPAELFVVEHDNPNDHTRFARRSITAMGTLRNSENA